MMKPPVALQLYSVRDVLFEDFESRIAQIAEMGYQGVELAGFGNLSAEEFTAVVKTCGMEIMGSHTQLADLENPSVINDLKAAGVRFTAIPWIGDDFRPGAPGYPSFVERVSAVHKALAGAGITLLYHNHTFELETLGGEQKLDIIYRDMPFLLAEPDTCWLSFAGVDPVVWLKRYAGRAPVVHLKDYVAQPEFAFRPVGDGVQNLEAVIPASTDAGAQWLVVEQDMPTTLSSMDSAKRSLDNIRKITG